ncbi:MAG: VWA domain-containing protein [Gemmataceae bacterium]|nr:VWA domain-containing protein [Gemmataceae bacterium]
MFDQPAKTSEQFEKFVLRRLEEPFPFFGQQLPEYLWWFALAFVLVPALVYVILMYAKDARGVGPAWASVLGTLRLLVYAILAFVFLLPAQQTFVKSETESKVITIFDVSGSMQITDQQSSGKAGEKLPTRQDQVLAFLREEKTAFVNRIVATNPMTAYRFGTKLDDEYVMFTKDGALTKSEREKIDPEDKAASPPKPSPLGESYWRPWLTPEIDHKLADSDDKRLKALDGMNAKFKTDKMGTSTNLGDSLMAILNKEMNNRVQGIVVFTDGRHNEGSTSAFAELSRRAKQAKVPIFVVGVGEDREKIQQVVQNLRVPPIIQPEDKFPIKVDLVGIGLAGQPVEPVLELAHVRVRKVKKMVDGKMQDVEEEEFLPIEAVERENPEDPKSARARETLAPGGKLTFKPMNLVDGKMVPAQVVYGRTGTQPTVEVEWQLDVAQLAAAAGKELPAGKKWEIGETKDDSDFRWVVKVPVDKREGLPGVEHHQSTRGLTKVVKKPLRVLMVAAGANRDFQFVQVLLAREVDKKRMELSVNLQLPPGAAEARTGVVQNVHPDRLLKTFPDTFKEKKSYDDLQSYDVIIMYDPDWRQISAQQVKLIKNWAEAGGGLIMVGGHINTVELIRPGEEGVDKFKPLLDLLPVVLDDRRDAFSERKADDPWPLNLDEALSTMEFMKLDEELDSTKFREDWNDFFYGEGKERTDKAQRGFYGFYPVKKVKVGSQVAARYGDPAVKMEDGALQPFIVTTPDTLPRAVWVGSAETWRLREYKEVFHERFWTKLVRYAGAKSKGGGSKPLEIEVDKTGQKTLKAVDVAAKIRGPGGEPLPRDAKPEITLKLPAGAKADEVNGGKPIVMTGRPGATDGFFSGKFVPRTAGEYEITVRVPRKNVPGLDADLIETDKVTVEESNPEKDNTRPDFDLMYRLASEADDVLRRMKASDAADLRKQLAPPKLAQPGAGAAEPAEGEKDRPAIATDKPRLYFTLANAHLIPNCMIVSKETSESRGPHRDWWDEGWPIYTPSKAKPDDPDPKPVKVSWVLIAVVGLLSAEWLTRKLLRLA